MSIRTFPSRFDQVLAAAIVCAGAVVSLWRVSPLWGHALVYADDLAGHVAIVQRMAEQLAAGNDPWFYDRWWFSGFGAFELYGLLGHFFAALAGFLFSGDGWGRAASAVNASLIIAVAAIPVTTCIAARSILRRCETTCSDAALAALSVAAAAIFLTVTEPGLPAGIAYGIGGGVFAQVLAWPLLMIYVALSAQGNNGPCVVLAALTFTVLYAMHPLTATAGLAAAFIVLLAFDGLGKACALSALTLGISAWLWLPMLLLAGEHGAGQPTWSERGALSVLADGWLDFFSGKPADEMRMLLEAALLAGAIGYILQERQNIRLGRIIVLLLIALWLTTGVELAESIAIGFHYSRLQAALSMVFLAISGVATAVLLSRVLPATIQFVAAIAVGAMAVLIVVNQPDALPARSEASPSGYDDERSLLNILSHLPADSRILFEYPVPENGDWSQFPGKYVEARLADVAKLETVNGLLTQSSRSYLLYATAMGKLGINMFSPAAPADRRFNLGLEGLADLLRRNGISHVVAARERSAASLGGVPGIVQIDQVGRYRLFALETPASRIQAVSVPMLGFVDLVGNLPFRLLDTYVEFDHRTSGRIRVVELEMTDLAQVEIDGLILNIEGTIESARWQTMGFGNVADIPTVTVAYRKAPRDFRAPRSTRHERQRYEAVHGYFEGIGLANTIAVIGSDEEPDSNAGNADLDWHDAGQQVQVSASAGRWYELAYSYLPAWSSRQALVRRGSAGHIFVWPQQETVELHYRRWLMPPVRIGLGISVLTLISLGIAAYRRKVRSRVPGGGSQE